MSYEPKRFDFSTPIRINLSSDTQTKPSRGMKEAMMDAEVGDEQMGSDPTIWELCDRIGRAAWQGSGGVPAVRHHVQSGGDRHALRPGRGDVGARDRAYPLQRRRRASRHRRRADHRLKGERGQFTVETLEDAIRPKSRYTPTQRLLEVEQTANIGGGDVLGAEAAARRRRSGARHGLSTHMDGARLMNAGVALGVPARDLVDGYDSVWLDFTKGLGAPLGAVLAGSQRIHRRGLALEAAAGRLDAPGRHLRRGLRVRAGSQYRPAGGGSRQCQGAGPWHGADPGVMVEMPETNLVFFDTEDTGMTVEEFAGKLRKEGVLVSTSGKYRGRACLHLDVLPHRSTTRCR